MEKKALSLLVFFAVEVFSQGPDMSKWLSIDCGSIFPYPFESMNWRTDDNFIKTGVNQVVSPYDITDLTILNTLRNFPKQNKNCYTLPASEGSRYFIRTTFYYGNYDSLSKPPTFDVQIDGNKWLTIFSSTLNDPVYHEIIYTSRGDNISVCLARTQVNQVPFISSLEAWPIPDNMYKGILNYKEVAWLNSQRLNYGTETWILGYPLDQYNRVWEPALPPATTTRLSSTIISRTVYEYPPDSAILDAVEGPDLTSPLALNLEASKANSLSYIFAYFTEVDFLAVNETRSFNITVNGTYEYTTSPQYQNCTGVWAILPNSGQVIAVELMPTAESTFPPIISAIEVYTASDPLVTMGTSQDDLDGLSVLIRTFDELNGWSGEPCLPSNTAWEWLECTGTDPPRVTSINLSRYALEGPVPDFRQMQSLQTIDMSNNRLNGQIPEFLGELPNLRLLNLDNNDFSGNVPDSIIHNKKVKLQVHGNPNLNYHPGGSKKIALIIGLAVGIPVLTIILVVALVFFLRRKHNQASQDQITAPESTGSHVGNGNVPERPEEGSESVTVSSVELSRPMLNMPEPGGEEIGNTNQAIILAEPVLNAGNSTYHQESMVPDMDMEELDELLQQRGEPQAHGRD